MIEPIQDETPEKLFDRMEETILNLEVINLKILATLEALTTAAEYNLKNGMGPTDFGVRVKAARTILESYRKGKT